MKRNLKVLVAIGFGLLAAITAGVYLAGKEAQIMQATEQRQVFVAAADIEIGTVLTDAHIAKRAIPQAYIQPGATENQEDIIDRVARTPILKNEQIVLTKLSTFGEERLSDLIPPPSEREQTGPRAVTISVSMVDGVAGLVRPGDRVDVLGRFNTVDEANGQAITMMKQVHGGLLVLAIDQNMQRGEAIKKSGGFGGQSGGGPEAFAGLVTFLTSADIAQDLLLAQELGNLSLLLRSAGDDGPLQLGIKDNRDVLSGRTLWSRSVGQESILERLGPAAQDFFQSQQPPR